MSSVSAVVSSFTRARHQAVMVDFDGTISDIVPLPVDARPVSGAVEALSTLARRGVATTVLSSRPVRFLLDVLHGLDPAVTLVGHSGLERVVAGEIEVVDEVAPWLPVVRGALERLSVEAPDGTVLEDKGLSVGLHFRQRPDLGDQVALLADRMAAETGLIAKPGRMNIELRPPVDIHKGTVVSTLLSPSSDWALVAGDDLVDLAAFEAVHRSDLEGIAVYVSSSEERPAMAAEADLVVASPSALVGLLVGLAEAPV